MDVFISVVGKPSIRKGKQYFKSNKIDLKVNFTRGMAQMTGLFGGNKELETTMNKFINDNAVEVFKEYKPTLENVWAELFGGLISRLFDNIPIDELFKP